MTPSSISYCQAIRETAKAMGRLASDNLVAMVEATAQSAGRFDPERSTVVFDGADGTVESVGDYLTREIGKFPQTTPAVASAGTKYTGRTAAAVGVAERIRLQDEADALAHAQALANGANPWSAATLNITKQAIIRKSLPQVAAQLKSRAGR